MRSTSSISARLFTTLRQVARLLAGRPGLIANDTGAIPVEYIAVFAFVIVGMTLAFIKLGPSLLNGWGLTQDVLLANKP